MQCHNCGKSVPDIAKFCPHCGSAQAVSPPQTTTKPRAPALIYTVLMILGIVVVGVGLAITFPTVFTGFLHTNDAGRISPPAQDVFQEEDPDEQAPASPTYAPASSLQEPTSPLIATTAPPALPSPTSPPEPTASLFQLQTNPSDQAELVLVPAGEFLMGSDPNTDPDFWGAEGPQHSVFLDSYWIYRTEVTNAMYQECVADQQCPRPVRHSAVNADDYYENPIYAHYPVVYVSYTHAAAYCYWAGGRLPTEAEWEKAARGTDGRLFPWGDAPPDSNQVNLCDRYCARGQIVERHLDDGYAGTSPVGGFPSGASPYSAYDMAGNVWEWTFDWFDSSFYSVSPYDNPNGPVSGDRHVIRGGSWGNPAAGVRVVGRISEPTASSLDTLGFRCVIDQVQQ